MAKPDEAAIEDEGQEEERCAKCGEPVTPDTRKHRDVEDVFWASAFPRPVLCEACYTDEVNSLLAAMQQKSKAGIRAAVESLEPGEDLYFSVLDAGDLTDFSGTLANPIRIRVKISARRDYRIEGIAANSREHDWAVYGTAEATIRHLIGQGSVTPEVYAAEASEGAASVQIEQEWVQEWRGD